MTYRRKETIGDATLYLGDCLEILPTLPKVDVLLSDPPYLLHAGAGGGAFGNGAHLVKTGGFTDGGIDYSFLGGFSNWLVFCSRLQLPELLSAAQQRKKWNLITWAKPNPVPTCNNKYLPDVEYVVHAFDWAGINGSMADKKCFFHEPTGSKTNGHPNEKPISLMEKLVGAGSKPEHIVADPFMGSGTTGVACANLGRKFIGIEIEERYFDIACERIAAAYAQGRLFA